MAGLDFNALGLILGKRTKAWQSGCPRSFGVFFRTNGHTMPNFRRLPNTITHDDEFCKKNCCEQSGNEKMLTKITQRASRQMTGYHCGYTFKPQRTSRNTLDSAFGSLQYFQCSLSQQPVMKQHRRAVLHAATDLYHNTTHRPMTDEFNLSLHNDDDDVLAAEFIRTFTSTPFQGRKLLQRYTAERKRKADDVKVQKMIPFQDDKIMYWEVSHL